MRKARTTERDALRLIRDLLKLAGAQLYHIRQHQGLGSTPGVPDITGCYQGRFFAVEVKAPRGKPTQKQKEHLEAIQHAGGIAFVAWGPDDVIREFEAKGFNLPHQMKLG